VLAWGVTAGIGIVSTEETGDAGRSLVGSCLGLAGAILGLWIALVAVEARLLIVIPSPENSKVPLLVRKGEPLRPGSIQLLESGDPPVLTLARVESNGRFEPVATPPPDGWTSRKWNTLGRVFFQFGGPGGGSVVPSEQKPP
jgi:hypothetical protein